MKLVIEGFETQEDVQAFVDWYEGQGEQDFGDSLEYASTQMSSANCVSQRDEGDAIVMTVRPTFD
jgi:hypothetical protein